MNVGRTEPETQAGEFYIGAHAAGRDYALLTRDARRYRTYFPTLLLIACDSPDI